ncbi:hypothetical protein LXL04_008957 [Taraxacum kok-saghyz]
MQQIKDKEEITYNMVGLRWSTGGGAVLLRAYGWVRVGLRVGTRIATPIGHPFDEKAFAVPKGVSKCKDFDGPMNSFKFVNFQTLLDNAVETDLAFDLIGDIVQVYELETHAAPNKNILKQTLIINDLRFMHVFNYFIINFSGFKVFVTLWEIMPVKL